MTDGVIMCRFETAEGVRKCPNAAVYIVCEPLTGYAFLVCDIHYPGLESTLLERCGCLEWTVQRINGQIFQKITGRPPLSDRGVTKLLEAENG